MSWNIDTAHTQIMFSVKHMMISTVRGRFTKFSGTVELDETKPELAKISGSVEVASIDTNEPQRDTHLRSPDFFASEQYPLITFRATRITRVEAEDYKLVGEITIRDVTREITFDVTNSGSTRDPWGKRHIGLQATARINRKDFGLNWNVALEAGGVLVGDQVKIDIELELVEQVAEPVAAGTNAA